MVAILSLLPCGDHGAEGSDAVYAQAHATITITHHAEHSEDLERCTPFCHCNCCHTCVTMMHIALYPVQPSPLHTEYHLLQYQMENQHQKSIWQPPNIA
jgi:hypothetical protein